MHVLSCVAQIIFLSVPVSFANRIQLKNLLAYDVINHPIRSKAVPSSIYFAALGRNFSIELNLSSTLIYKTELNLIQGDEIIRHKVELPEELHGYLKNDADSKVNILIGSRDEFYATIKTDGEVYLFEPLSYFEQWSTSPKILAYRLSDVILPNISLSYDGLFPLAKYNQIISNDRKMRHRRGLPPTKRFCGLHFVADYSFFAHVGSHDYAKTVDIIVKAFNRINEIFMSTEFIDVENGNDSQRGYGFYIKGISIETSPTPASHEVFSAKALLSSFSRRNFTSACLHHFLTFSKNPFGVLGMSWMAGPSVHHLGGICSSINYVDAGPEGKARSSIVLTPNTGFTTYCDSEGEQVLSSVAELVTAHELGHSWGAPHDPDTAECTPSAENGGRFLMYTFAVPGYSANNYRFSPCSRRAIGRCLASRAELCFEEKPFAGLPMSQCGNSRLDPGEECDPGSRVGGAQGQDPCCTSICRLKPGAKCSPLDHQCCTSDCQLLKKGTLCAEPDPTVSPCLSAGHCDGKSPVCPGPLPLSDVGRRCYEHGHCLNGVCLPFCSRLGLRTCICDKADDSCLICCSFDLETANEERRSMCQPIVALASSSLVSESTPLQAGSWRLYQLPFSTRNVSGNEEKYFFMAGMDVEVPEGYEISYTMAGNTSELVKMHLEDNRPCAVGFCRSGVCVESKTQGVGRLWPLFLSTETMTTLLWDNIVSVIVTLSLIVWIPLSCIVRLYDKKLREAQLNAAKIATEAAGLAPGTVPSSHVAPSDLRSTTAVHQDI
ncbi:adam 17 protease [Echinococcus multilocularis]|uniref:Adam 17 protease n=1 Tax=Echinococcus multilocularis TaxID=6211 RepID=A0A068YG18_ECHMU|nr:adam 17 protease [Echinococcus multilocularis]